MRNLLRKYKAVLLISIQSGMEYRSNFLFSLVSGAFAVIIQFFVWKAVYGGSDDVMFGYNYQQMLVYVIMAGILGRFVATGFQWDIAVDIKEGGLNRFLVQPIRYLPYRVLSHLGTKIVQLLMLLVLSAGVFLAMWLTLGYRLDIWNVVQTIPALILAVLLNCIVYYCISASAFYVTEVVAIYIGLDVVTMMLSGGFFPLTVFGTTAMKIFSFLPFSYIVSFPLNVLEGKCSQAEYTNGLLLQFVWIIGIYLLARLVWRAGSRRYVAIN